MHLEVAAEASMVDAGAPNLARDMLAFGARSEAANSAPHAAGRWAHFIRENAQNPSEIAIEKEAFFLMHITPV